jgi:hypothetical protein
MNCDVETIKNIVDIISGLATAIGLIVGGIWTYLLFVRQRLKYPRAIIALSTTKVAIDNNSYLLHVALRISNTGNVIMRPQYAEIRLRQVVPVATNVADLIQSRQDVVEGGKSEVLWPMLFEREWNWDPGKFEIEPGEYDILHADFVVSAQILAVQFYAFVKNETKKGRNIGWTETVIFKMNDHSTGGVYDK